MKKDRQEVSSACQPYCLYIQPDAHKKTDIGQKVDRTY